MDGQGLIPFGKDAPTHALMGRFGNVMMVNGETDYRLTAKKGEVVRFFLTNVANTRTFNVRFGGAKVKVVASDVGRYEREQWVPSVIIAPAERYVVDVRFDEPGRHAIINAIQAINHFRGEFYSHVDTLALVDVSDEPASPDLSGAFRTLRTNDDVVADIERYRPLFDKDAGQAAGDHRAGERAAGAHRAGHGDGHALRAAGGVQRRHAHDELAVHGRSRCTGSCATWTPARRTATSTGRSRWATW